MRLRRRSGRIAPALLPELEAVEATGEGFETRRPCSVTLTDGTLRDRVYVVAAEERSPSGGDLPIGRVAAIRSSPLRLAPALAQRIYDAGESGMGYCVFTLVLADGRRLAFASGGPVDFPALPARVTMAMVADVEVHEGRDVAVPGRMAPADRCLYRPPGRGR